MWILSVLGFAKNAEMKKKNPNNWEMFIIIGFNSQNVMQWLLIIYFP